VLCGILTGDQIEVLLRAMADEKERARHRILQVAMPWREPTEAFALRPNPRATKPLLFIVSDLDQS
jgi:hypothetical protein